MFFNSAFVPSAVAPRRRTETLASQRRDPSSMFPSLIPSARTSVRRGRTYSAASSSERCSGSLTTSHSGTRA